MLLRWCELCSLTCSASNRGRLKPAAFGKSEGELRDNCRICGRIAQISRKHCGRSAEIAVLGIHTRCGVWRVLAALLPGPGVALHRLCLRASLQCKASPPRPPNASACPIPCCVDPGSQGAVILWGKTPHIPPPLSQPVNAVGHLRVDL